MKLKYFSEITPLNSEHKSGLDLFLQSFIELLHSPEDIFYLFSIELVSTLGVSILTSGLSIYLTSIKEISDVTTGYILAGFGASAFLYSMILGSFIDKYGIKRTLFCGNMSALVGLVIIVLIPRIEIQITSILTFVSAGSSVLYPSIKLGIKHYANEEAKSLGFSTFYIIFFFAGSLAGIIIDLAMTILGKTAITFHILFTIGSSLMLIATILTAYITYIEIEAENIDSWEITKEVLKSKVFLKFMSLNFLLVIIKSLYAHFTITLPLYMNREIESNAHFGYMLAVHRGIMVVCIPLLTCLVYYFNNYSLLIFAGMLSSLSVVPLIFDSGYSNVMLYIILVSLGESLYAPRLIDYTLRIAPKGKEGTFVALATSPLQLSIIVAGITGGFLLSEYCPEQGVSRCWAVWVYIGSITVVAPLGMIIFRDFLEEKYDEDKFRSYDDN